MAFNIRGGSFKGRFKNVSRINLIRNGVRYSGNINPRKILRLKQLFLTAISSHLKFVMKETKDEILQRVSMRSRPIKDDTTSLSDAYKTALSEIQIGMSKNILNVRMLDASVLDELLPMGGENPGKGGWWRIHEYGSATLVGEAPNHMFVSKEFMAGRLKDRLTSPVGHHDEGLLVKRDSKLLNGVDFKPFKGVKPMRILRVAKADFENRMLQLKRIIPNEIARNLTS